jgi:hypothetical protein
MVFAMLGGIGTLGDNSFLTHLATGREILDGGVPGSDPYSFTANGESWVVQSWLVSTVLAVLENLGGAAAIRIFFGVASAALAGLAWKLTSGAKTLIPRVLLGGLVILLGTLTWSERPLMVGLLSIAAVLMACEGRLDPRWLVPVGWIWMQSHGSFPLGLVAALTFAAGARLDGQSPVQELRTFGWLALGILAGVVGPLGIAPLLFPVQLLSKQETLSTIVEWQSPSFADIGPRMFLVFLLLAIAGLARRPSWRAGLPLLVFTAAALMALRNMSVASLVLLPGAAACWRDLGTVPSELPVLRRSLAVVLLGVFVPLLALVSLTEDHFALDGYPVEAIDLLEEAGHIDPNGDGTDAPRIIAPDFVGNYLEFRYGTSQPVYIDDRYDMYPVDVAKEYGQLLHVERNWPEVLEERNPDFVLWSLEGAFAQVLLASPDWVVAYETEDWLVFEAS